MSTSKTAWIFFFLWLVVILQFLEKFAALQYVVDTSFVVTMKYGGIGAMLEISAAIPDFSYNLSG
jgi:hypothetical protein